MTRFRFTSRQHGSLSSVQWRLLWRLHLVLGPTFLWTSTTTAFHLVVPSIPSITSSIGSLPPYDSCHFHRHPSRTQSLRHVALFSTSSLEEEQQQPLITVLNNTDLPIQRIYCLSDLHTDHVDNLEWLRKHTHHLTPQDLVVVAGDISHDRDTFRTTLRVLRRHQSHIFFLVGNHEAWLHAKHDAHISGGSLQKFRELYSICHEEGVYADTVLQIPIATNSSSVHEHDNSATNSPEQGESSSVFPPCLQSSSVWIIPLHSWYDGSLSFAEEYCQDFGKWPWVDFIKTQWNDTRFPIVTDPSALDYRMPRGLTDYLHHQQAQRDSLLMEQINVTTDQIVTVSHFLPNSQCLPDWKDLDATEFDTDSWLDHGGAGVSAKFAKVAGTTLLDQHIRRLTQQPSSAVDMSNGADDHRPNMPIHIFGHSHRPKDFVYQGIRYVHNPLGKPRERLLHMISPRVNFQLLWEHGRVVEASVPVIRYWEEQGGGVPKLKERLQRFQRRRKRRYGRYESSPQKASTSSAKSSGRQTSEASSSQKKDS